MFYCWAPFLALASAFNSTLISVCAWAQGVRLSWKNAFDGSGGERDCVLVPPSSCVMLRNLSQTDRKNTLGWSLWVDPSTGDRGKMAWNVLWWPHPVFGISSLSPNFQAVVLHNLHKTARNNFLLKTINHIFDRIRLTEKKTPLLSDQFVL